MNVMFWQLQLQLQRDDKTNEQTESKEKKEKKKEKKEKKSPKNLLFFSL